MAPKKKNKNKKTPLNSNVDLRALINKNRVPATNSSKKSLLSIDSDVVKPVSRTAMTTRRRAPLTRKVPSVEPMHKPKNTVQSDRHADPPTRNALSARPAPKPPIRSKEPPKRKPPTRGKVMKRPRPPPRRARGARLDTIILHRNSRFRTAPKDGLEGEESNMGINCPSFEDMSFNAEVGKSDTALSEKSSSESEVSNSGSEDKQANPEE